MIIKRSNPQWLSLFRIGTATILFASFISLWPDYDRLFSAEGLADRQLFLLQHPAAIDHPALQPGVEWMRFAYLIGCILLAAGFFTRIAAAALMLLQYLIFTSYYSSFSYGFDYIASSCLFYCLLFPIDRKRDTGAVLSLRFLQAHVCIIYFFAGLGKLLGPTWRNGEALWKAVVQPGFESFFKPDLHFLGAYPTLWVIGGWAVALLEISYPVLIWPKRVRSLWLWAIISLHIGIALLMGLYFFSALMILLNLAAFHVPYIPTAKHRKTSIIDHPLSTRATGSETPAVVDRVENKPRLDV